MEQLTDDAHQCPPGNELNRSVLNLLALYGYWPKWSQNFYQWFVEGVDDKGQTYYAFSLHRHDELESIQVKCEQARKAWREHDGKNWGFPSGA